MKGLTLLTFDVEEFDIPLEYNQNISIKEQMQVGINGLNSLMPLLEKYNIQSTFFTTANFAQTYPEVIKQLSVNNEIASHTFFHSSFKNADLLRSKETLENIINKKVTGLRMPRMRHVEMQEVKKAGYLYDSSINPTYIPGRYNNFNLSRVVYEQEGIIRVPASVSPGIRLPLFWLAFKNYPYIFFKTLCLQTLKKDGYLSLYFHPWEFTTIGNYKLPGYVKSPDGKILLERLERLINDLSPYSSFITINDYLLLKQFLKK